MQPDYILTIGTESHPVEAARWTSPTGSTEVWTLWDQDACDREDLEFISLHYMHGRLVEGYMYQGGDELVSMSESLLGALSLKPVGG